jgi:hypothetical protein
MRPAKALSLSACLGLALSASAAQAAARKAADLPRLYWYAYTVDSSSLQGYSRIRFDAKDSLKVAYRGPGKSVRYAELDHHRFRVRNVDDVAGAESKLDMALDGEGFPHIYYQTSDNTKFVYARMDGSGWARRDLLVQQASNLDYYMVAVEADAGGDLHFAQSIFDTVGHDVNNSLSYITLPKGGSPSAPAFIDRTGRNGKWGGMSLDADGNPILAYFDFAGANLAFSRKSGDAWIRRVIDSAQFDTKKGKFSTVRQRGSEYVITTLSEARKKILLITGKDTSWTLENVDDFPLFATFSTQIAMDLDKDGVPHLAYPRVKSAEEFTAATAGLVLARKDGSGWKIDTVDGAENVGEYASLDIGPSGRIAISYMDRKDFTLKVLVSSLSEPPDANKDGIPDYKQIPNSIRKKKVLGLGASRTAPGRLIDAGGRALPASGKAGKRPAAGKYFPGSP